MKNRSMLILLYLLLFLQRVLHIDQAQADGFYEKCTFNSTTCVEGPGVRVINGVSIYLPCWKTQKNYNCLTTATTNKCAGLESTNECSLASSSCSIMNDGACVQTRYVYSCSGALDNDDITYINESNVVVNDEIVETCDISDEQLGECKISSEVCVEGGGTRIIEGVSVTKNCWKWDRVYDCTNLSPVNTCEELAENCTFVLENCLSQNDDGTCTYKEMMYSCPVAGSTPTTQTFQCNQAVYCIGDDCTQAEIVPNQDFGEAASDLAVLGEMANEVTAEFTIDNLNIFTGKRGHCDWEAVFSMDNCCDDSGYGNDLGLASCPQEELDLAKYVAAGQTHYIATHCATENWFGGCAVRQRVYCVYPSKISRIIMEQARLQLGRNWGTISDPDCSGLTVEEIGQLDFSKMDLSEIMTDMNISSPNSSGLIDAIKNKLETGYENISN